MFSWQVQCLCQQYFLDLSRISCALSIPSDEFNFSGFVNSQTQLYSALDLVLLEYLSAGNLCSAAVIAQQGYANSIQGTVLGDL